MQQPLPELPPLSSAASKPLPAPSVSSFEASERLASGNRTYQPSGTPFGRRLRQMLGFVLGGGVTVTLLAVLLQFIALPQYKPTTIFGMFEAGTELAIMNQKLGVEPGKIAYTEADVREKLANAERKGQAAAELDFQKQLAVVQADKERVVQAYATLYQRANFIAQAAIQLETIAQQFRQQLLAMSNGGRATVIGIKDLFCGLGSQEACTSAQSDRRSMISESDELSRGDVGNRVRELNLALYRMEAQGLDQPACGRPVLFIMDEFAALGKLESIEKAAGLMAGYGVKLMPVLQDLGQLKRHYKESWETFLGNAGVLQFFANADLTTLEWLSKRMGKVELIRETCGSSDSSTTGLSRSQSQTESSGWSKSSGVTKGSSDMAELQSIATRDGGSGLVPFLARSGASGVGHSEGWSTQDGSTGGNSRQQGDGSSSGISSSASTSEGIHLGALLNPDEIARLFDRRTGRQIVLIDGLPVALNRTDYDSDPAFASYIASAEMD